MDRSSVKNTQNIWRFGSLFPDCPPREFQIDSRDIQSPVEILTDHKRGECLLKREDFQPSGSHKERAAVFQISRLCQKNVSAAVLSSSGNAGIALSEYARRAGVTLLVFMSRNTPAEKVLRVQKNGAFTFLVKKPVNFANYVSRVFKIPNLKPSRDPNAVVGFMSLGFEIHEQFHRAPPPAVFIFSTSGASCLGIGKAFKVLVEREKVWTGYPQLHAVQSGRATDLAAEFDKRQDQSRHAGDISVGSRAGFGGVRKSPLLPDLKKIITETGGFAWYISPDEVCRGEEILSEAGVTTSREGAAAVFAVNRWRQAGGMGQPLVILTGRKTSSVPVESDDGYLHPESYIDLKKCVDELWRQQR